MDKILITNNLKVYNKYFETMDIIYKEESYLDILYTTRDRIHQGHELLSHPLSGSIKPNETPFKSIIISKKIDALDMKGLNIIEESIITTEKFLKDRALPIWDEKVLDDFRTIDLSLIENLIR